MTTRTVRVANTDGIHCRPSALIIKELRGYAGRVTLVAEDGRQSTADSILALLSLALRHDEAVTVEVAGPDEEQVADRIAELLETEFDFPR